MSRHHIALLALLPSACVSAAHATAPATPRGDVMFRPECYGAVLDEERSVGLMGGGTTGTRGRASAPGKVGTSGFGAGGGFRAMSPAADASAPAGTAPVAVPRAEPTREMNEAEDSRRTDAIVGKDVSADHAFGAEVWLSNDDSMSLASAQRMLYAVMNDLPIELSQIRPHELLNYFSFDTREPVAGDPFGVMASAERHGDELSVALAVKGATPPRQPLDLTLVVDRSGSMSAEGRMDYTKRGLALLSEQLVAGDRVDLVLFDDTVCVPLENWVAGRDDRSLLDRAIAGLRPEGSTDLDLGLREGYRVTSAKLDTQGRNRRMMLLTDALLNTGNVDPHTVSEVGRRYGEDGIRLTGVGVGSEFNDKVLDLLTEKGKGAYVFLGSEAVVDRVFGESGFASLTQTVAHDVQFLLKLPPSLALERFYGEEASTVESDVQPIHYYAGTSQLFLQDLVLKDGRVVPTDPIELEIRFHDAVTGAEGTKLFRTTVGRMLAADPHNVRKARALHAWTDMLLADAMGGDACGETLDTYASRAGRLADDAEIAFVNGLVRGRCGTFELPSVVSNEGVPFKVRVDSDVAIGSIALACGESRWTEKVTPEDAIARFEDAAPGVCDLTLSGAVDMTARVEVPSTGGDLRCIVRGGRIACS